MICVNQVSSQSHNQCYDAREHTSELTHESPCSKSDHKAQWEQRVVLPIDGHHNFPHQNLKQAEDQADEQSRTEPEMEELHEEFGDIFRNTARIAERRRKVRACVRKELCRFQKPQSSESQDTPEPKGHCEKKSCKNIFPFTCQHTHHLFFNAIIAPRRKTVQTMMVIDLTRAKIRIRE